MLAEQKRRALRREVLTACPSLFSLEASTIATQPSILSLDSHATLASSTLGTSSSVMTTVSEEGHHKVRNPTHGNAHVGYMGGGTCFRRKTPA